MAQFKLTVFLSFLFISLNSIAYAPSEGNVATYFGPYLYKTRFAGSNTGSNSPNLGGLGLVVLGDVSSQGSLEIGIFYLNKIYIREELGKYLSQQTGLIHITMGYRRWLSEMFSASLAFSSGYAMGEIQTLHSDFVPGSEIDTSAKDNTEFGFDLSLLTEIWKTEKYSVVLDTRYFFSVTAKENEYADHYGALLAVKYLMQEKTPEKSISLHRILD